MRHYKITILFVLIFNLISAQNTKVEKASIWSADFQQVKESANFGLVFKGGGVEFGQGWRFVNDNRIISYNFDLGVGITAPKKIPALGVYLKPVDFNYLFRIHLPENNLFLGPNLKAEYNYYIYPQLQSGFDYWFSNMSLGFSALYGFSYKKSEFELKLNSSVLGFSSRQPASRNPYFFDLGVDYALVHVNQNLSFGSFNKFNVTDFEIRWKPKPSSKYTYGYSIKYAGYYHSPEISLLNQSFKLIINK